MMHKPITRMIVGYLIVLMINVAGISLVHHLHGIAMASQIRDILSFGTGVIAATISIPIFEYVHTEQKPK